MPKRLFRFPSPALVIAMVALVLVLGGTAIAAGTSAPLTKASVTRLIRHLAPTLRVGHAWKADNAATVGAGAQSVRTIRWKVAPGTTTQTILGGGVMRITGSCDASSNITVDASGPDDNDGELRIQGNVDGVPFFKNLVKFDSASSVSLVNTDGAQGEGSGQLVVATNDGSVETFDYGFDYGTAGSKAYDGTWEGCTLYGELVYH